MINQEEFFRLPEWKEILSLIKYEISEMHRPPDQIILDDTDLCKILKISKRTASTLRTTGQIVYYKCGKTLYKLSDVLAYIERNKVQSTLNKIKTRFK